MPQFSHLAQGLSVRSRQGAPDPLVEAVTADSRRVTRGDVFVAIDGADQDGHAFLHDAARAGAGALIVDATRTESGLIPDHLPVFEADDTRVALAHLVRRLHGEPDRRLQVVAVTGTNGKTSIAHLGRDLFRARGQSSGLLGTIRYETGRAVHAADLTTPGPERLYAYLREMVEADLAAVCLEASSHALSQFRLGPLEVDVAVFTNLTRDHLDYHADAADYFRAKLRLLDRLQEAGRVKPPGRAVVWMDDPTFAAHPWPASTVTVGRSGDVDVRLLGHRSDRRGSDLTVSIQGRTISARSSLLGGFNVDNVLLTLGLGLAQGMTAEALAAAVPHLRPVPGRLDPVHLEGGPVCVVDYAHTPDGLRSALSACRELCTGRVILVFGCGGDRDRGKRPLMARAASEGADLIVLTQDNPRQEDPAQIFADVQAGFGATAQVQTIDDRGEAIAAALDLATPHDLVLVAGKGHETYQHLASGKQEWSDHDAIRRAWEARA